MISSADVQEAVISMLKADPALVANLGAGGQEVREESWMGQDYHYPCVRVHVTQVAPLQVASNCKAFTVDFNVAYRQADPSSKPTADGMALATGVLLDKALSGSGFVSEGLMVLQQTAGPVPESQAVWMARAFFSVRIRET